MGSGYQTKQFAALTGVTVRTLHHYDRLGLLRPRRSPSGYRLYYERDLERLEKISALKYVGIPLKQIRELLDRDHTEFMEVLGRQRRVLEVKRRLLDRAIQAIGEAEAVIASGCEADAAMLTKIIEVLEMENNPNWATQYYSEAAREKIEARRKEWTPELQAQAIKDWTDLYRDVEAALHEDPAGEKAQALAARWKKLVAGFTGGDPEVSAGLKKLWQDQPNWPQPMQQQMKPFVNPAVWEFIAKAMGCAQ